MRVFGDNHDELGKPDELLIEVRVARDRQTIPGQELLRIEWMLLQNPRASWVAGRAPLPGQRHPGLRMFAEVALLMLIVCERLALAGIVVVPSHYHVAARWHARMRFLDPVVEGRFRALERVLAPLSLAEASIAVELGRVTELESSGRAYTPAPATSCLRAKSSCGTSTTLGAARQRNKPRSSNCTETIIRVCGSRPPACSTHLPS